MEPNTQEILGLYKALGDKIAGDGQPILSVYQQSVTTVTTFMRERKFDPTTGAEQGPLDHEVNVPAIAASAQEIQGELDAINALNDLINSVTPSAGIKVRTGAASQVTP